MVGGGWCLVDEVDGGEWGLVVRDGEVYVCVGGGKTKRGGGEKRRRGRGEKGEKEGWGRGRVRRRGRVVGWNGGV